MPAFYLRKQKADIRTTRETENEVHLFDLKGKYVPLYLGLMTFAYKGSYVFLPR